MKYFKIIDLTTGKDYLVSSTLPNETAAHVAMSAHLDLEHKHRVEEISAREFYGLPSRCHDPDIEDDYEDDDDECYD
jgi:hypothetical protein